LVASNEGQILLQKANKLMVRREDPFKVLEWMGTIPTSWT